MINATEIRDVHSDEKIALNKSDTFLKKISITFIALGMVLDAIFSLHLAVSGLEQSTLTFIARTGIIDQSYGILRNIFYIAGIFFFILNLKNVLSFFKNQDRYAKVALSLLLVITCALLHIFLIGPLIGMFLYVMVFLPFLSPIVIIVAILFLFKFWKKKTLINTQI